MKRKYTQPRAEVCTTEQTITKSHSSFLPLIHTDQSGRPVGTLAFEPDGVKQREQDGAAGWPRTPTEQQQRENTENIRN